MRTSDIKVGKRVRLPGFEVYPFVKCTEDAIGTVHHVEADYAWIELDKPEMNAEYDEKTWQNNTWPLKGIQIMFENDDHESLVPVSTIEWIPCRSGARPPIEEENGQRTSSVPLLVRTAYDEIYHGYYRTGSNFDEFTTFGPGEREIEYVTHWAVIE